MDPQKFWKQFFKNNLVYNSILQSGYNGFLGKHFFDRNGAQFQFVQASVDSFKGRKNKKLSFISQAKTFLQLLPTFSKRKEIKLRNQEKMV